MPGFYTDHFLSTKLSAKALSINIPHFIISLQNESETKKSFKEKNCEKYCYTSSHNYAVMWIANN